MTDLLNSTKSISLLLRFSLVSSLAISVSGCDKNPLKTFFSKEGVTNETQIDKKTPNSTSENSKAKLSKQAIGKVVYLPIQIKPKFYPEFNYIEFDYNSITYHIDPNDENPMLSRQQNKQLLDSPIPVDFNYIYGDDIITASQHIELFMQDKNKGAILLPMATEEFPNYMIVSFDNHHFLTKANLMFEQFGCDKIDKIIFNNGKYNIYQNNKLCKTATTNLKKLKSQAQPKNLSTKLPESPLPVQTQLTAKQLPLPLSAQAFEQKYNKDINTEGEEGFNEFPFKSQTIDEAINKIMGGSSDSGYYELPKYGDYHVYLGYNLFENESEENITEDNPDGAYVGRENYLIVTDGKNINYQDLGDHFNIDKAYQAISIKSLDKTQTYRINHSGKIVEN